MLTIVWEDTMITVKYKFAGGKTQVIDVKNNATVADVLAKTGINASGYIIKVKGKPADSTTELTSTSLITFAEKVKGGCTASKAQRFYKGISPFLVKLV